MRSMTAAESARLLKGGTSNWFYVCRVDRPDVAEPYWVTEGHVALSASRVSEFLVKHGVSMDREGCYHMSTLNRVKAEDRDAPALGSLIRSDYGDPVERATVDGVAAWTMLGRSLSRLYRLADGTLGAIPDRLAACFDDDPSGTTVYASAPFQPFTFVRGGLIVGVCMPVRL